MTLRVTEIAMGQNHMLALCHDRLSQMQTGVALLSYAANIFDPLREYLLREGRKIFQEKNKYDNVLLVKDR